jgi:dTDP-4-amino-4,6-dideoxygalactose transaminase
MSERRDIPFGRPSIGDGERQAVLEVLNGHILTHGPQCKAFETEFAAFMGPDAHALSVSSCMAALHLAYLHFGVGPGDEVIVPAQTHTATVHAVEWTGARPVFVDCDPATGNLTADRIARAITPRTRAVSVVHFLGIPCDMPPIVALAEAHGLKVIEDCALAVGARWQGRHVGLFGDAGCFSFYPVKHITTGEGGMLVSRHKAVAEGVAKLRAFGVDRTHTERAVPGMYDVPTLGLNYRMSELQAAIGRVQISRIGWNLDGRQARFTEMAAGLRRIPGLRVLDSTSADGPNSHYCLSIVLEGPLAARRAETVARLNEAGVGTSVYYPHPVPRLKYYQGKYGYDASAFVNAAAISDCSIALPVSWHIEPADVSFIVERVGNALMETTV